jgi:ABC-type uncharacterized transport system permease subunit
MMLMGAFYSGLSAKPDYQPAPRCVAGLILIGVAAGAALGLVHAFVLPIALRPRRSGG